MIASPVRYSPAVEDVRPDEAATIEGLCETFDNILLILARSGFPGGFNEAAALLGWG